MEDKREEKIWAKEEGDKEERKRAARRAKGDRSTGGKEEADRKRKESNSGWTGADLSWLAIRRTSRP